MKMRKIYSAALAAALAISLAIPARAGGEDLDTPAEQPSVQDPVVQPEAPVEVPGWLLGPESGEQVPETPADSTAPESPGQPVDPEIPETPAISETPETPEAPENPEIPGETPPPTEPETPEVPAVPENPSQPPSLETPETPVIPEIPETPVLPETPINPEDPAQPPSWLLPPGEAPLPDAAPSADEPALLPPENAIAEETPVIEVLVPSSGQIIINPYGQPMELDGQTSTDQIISTPLILQNLSTVPVSVSASVTGTVPPGSGVSFAAAPTVLDSPAKEIFLFAEFQAVPEPAFQPAWSGVYSDSTNQLLVGFQGTAKTDILRLEASGAAYSFGAMRLFGSTAVSPMVPWQTGDDARATFVFSFTPIAEANADDVPAMDEAPVTEMPVMDAPVTDTPVMDAPVSGEPTGPLPDAAPGVGELTLPSWLFDT